MDPAVEDEIDLRQYVVIALRYRRIIAAVTVLTALVTTVVVLVLPASYQATALTSVTPPRYSLRLEGVNQANAAGAPQQQPMKSYPDLALSDEVVAGVLVKFESGLPNHLQTLESFRRGMLKATASTDVTLIRLEVTDTDPNRAAQIANTWAQAFTQNARRLYGLDAANLASYKEQLAQAKTSLDKAEQANADFQSKNQVAILQAELNSQQARLTDLLSRRSQLILIIQNAQDLRARLTALDANAPSTIADDLTLIQLSTQYSTSSQASPFQLQVVGGQSLSGKKVGEQIFVVDNLLKVFQARLKDIEAQVANLSPEILSLQGKLAEAQTQAARLQRAKDLADGQYVRLSNKVQEASVAAQESDNVAQVASAASVPTERAGSRMLVVVVSTLVSLMLCTVLIFVREWWSYKDG